jgi:hypothetical protein
VAFAAAVPLLLSSLLARPAALAGTTAVRIEWDAPAGCSDPATFFGSIESRLGRARRAEAWEDAVRLAVRLDRVSGAQVHGELRLFDGDGRSEVRKVDGGTCEEVAEALALTAALALGAARSWSPNPEGAPAAAGPRPTATPAAPPSPRTPVPLASGSTKASPSLSSSPPTLASPLAPPPPRTAPPVPDAAPGGPLPLPVRPAARAEGAPPRSGPDRFAPPPRPVGFVIGLGPVAGRVVSPTYDLGAALMGRAVLRAPASGRGGGLEPSLDLSVTHLRNTLLGASPDVAITWTAVALIPCPGWGLAGLDGRLVVEACASTALGRLAAAEEAVTVARSVTRFWWSAGPVLRVRLALRTRWLLQVDASAHIPIIRRTFVTSTPEETVARTPAIAGMVGFILGREL